MLSRTSMNAKTPFLKRFKASERYEAVQYVDFTGRC